MMKLIATTLVETVCHIVDADISEQMTVVLLKGKGEHIVMVDDVEMFTVSPHMHMLRIVGSELVLYDGQELYFYTLDGTCTQQGDCRASCTKFISNEGCRCTYLQ